MEEKIALKKWNCARRKVLTSPRKHSDRSSFLCDLAKASKLRGKIESCITFDAKKGKYKQTKQDKQDVAVGGDPSNDARSQTRQFGVGQRLAEPQRGERGIH